MSALTFDVAVIGSGPGGYVAAVRAAQLGKKVVCIDRYGLGGTCLNWGCIPSKALIHAGGLVEDIREAETIGITTGPVKVDWQKVLAWKDGIIKRLTTGISHLFKEHGITHIVGSAKFTGPKALTVTGAKGTDTVSFGAAIIATGARPIEIPGFKFDGKRVISAKEALELPAIPATMAVIGGGVIGLEIGTFYAKLGTKVTVVELTPGLLPGTDPECTAVVARGLRRRRVTVHLGTKAKGVREGKSGFEVVIETPKGEEGIPADVVLVAVGMRPFTEDLGLAAAGVKTNERGFIPVNERRETNVPGIFAVGDVAGGPLLAHKASKEGIIAAEVIAGKKSAYDVNAMPTAIFTDPEIASVGMTEEQAKAASRAIRVGKFPFTASGRALTTGDSDGFVKVIADAKTDLILGMHVVGPEASNLISEGALAIEMGAVADDLALTVHPHPTLPEGAMEAAAAIGGHAIHVMGKV